MIQKIRDLFRRRTADPEEIGDAVLRVAYRAMLAEPNVSAGVIAQEMSLPEEVVFDALEGLAEEECIEARVLRGSIRTIDVMVVRVLPDGLRRLGAWPQ